MGWFGNTFGSERSTGGDPLQKLDPKLREFLERESPVKYTSPDPSQASQTQTQTQQAPSQQPPPTHSSESAATELVSEGAVPPQSLYQDGRYAHLWKNYRPQAAIDAETKSDHEKLMDVLDAYKERKAEIGKAALENCALEQVDWTNCMRSGSVTARMTLCRDEVRKFERCYKMQARFLKALGYLSVENRSREIEEDIQMHADKLYHQLAEQEEAIDLAKKEGRPVPKFEPLKIQTPGVAQAEEEKLPSLTPELQKTWNEQLEKMPEEDRQAEEIALKAELKAKAEVAEKVKGIWEEQAKEREIRRQEGRLTVGDRINSIFGR